MALKIWAIFIAIHKQQFLGTCKRFLRKNGNLRRVLNHLYSNINIGKNTIKR